MTENKNPESKGKHAIVICITEFQRKRLSVGRTVPVMRDGQWYKLQPANKTKVHALKLKLKELRQALKKEMGVRTNGNKHSKKNKEAQ